MSSLLEGYWKTIVSCFLRTKPLLKYQTTGLTWDKEHCSLQVEPRGAGTRCSQRGKMWTELLPQWYLRQSITPYERPGANHWVLTYKETKVLKWNSKFLLKCQTLDLTWGTDKGLVTRLVRARIASIAAATAPSLTLIGLVFFRRYMTFASSSTLFLTVLWGGRIGKVPRCHRTAKSLCAICSSGMQSAGISVFREAGSGFLFSMWLRFQFRRRVIMSMSLDISLSAASLSCKCLGKCFRALIVCWLELRAWLCRGGLDTSFVTQGDVAARTCNA